MTALRNIFIAGGNILRRVAGESITYKRGLATVAMRAVRANNEFDIVENDGQIVIWHSCDFWIRAEDLVMDNRAIKPQRGDRIIDSDGRIFEVNAPADKPIFDEIYETAEFLVHTREIN